MSDQQFEVQHRTEESRFVLVDRGVAGGGTADSGAAGDGAGIVREAGEERYLDVEISENGAGQVPERIFFHTGSASTPSSPSTWSRRPLRICARCARARPERARVAPTQRHRTRRPNALDSHRFHRTARLSPVMAYRSVKLVRPETSRPRWAPGAPQSSPARSSAAERGDSSPGATSNAVFAPWSPARARRAAARAYATSTLAVNSGFDSRSSRYSTTWP